MISRRPRLRFRHPGSSEDMGRRVWPIAVGLGTSSFQLLPPLFKAQLGVGWLDPESKARIFGRFFRKKKWLSDSGYLIGFHDLSCQLSYLLRVAAFFQQRIFAHSAGWSSSMSPSILLPNSSCQHRRRSLCRPYRCQQCQRQDSRRLNARGRRFDVILASLLTIHIFYKHMHTHADTHTHMHAYVCIYVFICVLIVLKILISDSWYSLTRTYPEIIAIHICPLATNQAMDIFFRFVGDFPLPFSLATGYQGTHGVLCKTIQNPKCLKEVYRRLHSSSLFIFLSICMSIYLRQW